MSDETKRAVEGYGEQMRSMCANCSQPIFNRGAFWLHEDANYQEPDGRLYCKPGDSNNTAQPIEGDGGGEATLTVKLFKAIAYPLVNAIGDISITECLDAIDRQLDQAVRNANR